MPSARVRRLECVPGSARVFQVWVWEHSRSTTSPATGASALQSPRTCRPASVTSLTCHPWSPRETVRCPYQHSTIMQYSEVASPCAALGIYILGIYTRYPVQALHTGECRARAAALMRPRRRGERHGWGLPRPARACAWPGTYAATLLVQPAQERDIRRCARYGLGTDSMRRTGTQPTGKGPAATTHQSSWPIWPGSSHSMRIRAWGITRVCQTQNE